MAENLGRRAFIEAGLACAAGAALALGAPYGGVRLARALEQGEASSEKLAAEAADPVQASDQVEQPADGSSADELGAGEQAAQVVSTAPLPPAAPDPDDDFGVDLNVNMDTIDDYLGIPGVAYRDMRLLKDPADYAAIGGDSVLSIAVEGFKVVPYPYIGTLQELPVEGAYTGERLFDVAWGDDGRVTSAEPRYEQSLLILQDLFPQDAPIVLCCGGGGYAAMTKSLLVYLGWDESLLYNAGGVWDYTGYRAIELARVEDDGSTSYFFWRADMAPIDFSLLTPVAAG